MIIAYVLDRYGRKVLNPKGPDKIALSTPPVSDYSFDFNDFLDIATDTYAAIRGTEPSTYCSKRQDDLLSIRLRNSGHKELEVSFRITAKMNLNATVRTCLSDTWTRIE